MLRFGKKLLEGRLRAFVVDGDVTTEISPAELQNVMDERKRVDAWRKRVDAKNEAARG